MRKTAFEPIFHEAAVPAKIFTASIGASSYHWHYDYELVLVLKGSVLVYNGPQPTLMQAGDILLVNSRAVHGLQRAKEQNLCLFIQFAPELLALPTAPNSRYHFTLNSAAPNFLPRCPYAVFVREAATAGLYSQQQGLLGRLQVTAQIYRLLACLVEHSQYEIHTGPGSPPPENTSELVVAVSQYVENHLQSPTLGTDVCRAFGTAEKTLYRILKNDLGITLKEMIDITRIEKAQQMLRGSKKPVSVIADTCGFASEMTFYRLFKKTAGVTPAVYRGNAKACPAKREIQGYLNFDANEANCLMKQMAAQQEGG
ncbi:MAG: AraC family transcriptional regulator [Oscillospiraceae bacterium]